MERVQRWIEERLFESVPVHIAVIDRDFGVVLANRGFEETFGDWRGKRCWEVYKGRAARCDSCPSEIAFRDGSVLRRQEVGRARDGGVMHYLVHVAPVRSEDGSIPYCIEMSTDITHLHRLEQEKIEAERLAAVGQTVAGLAHGIKNIITGLEGGMYVMRSGMEKGRGDRVESGWKMLERNVERISIMARNLLSFSKGHTPDVRLADPCQLARDVVDLYREAAAKLGVALECRCGDGVEPARIDQLEMHACIANLVSNAIDACQMSDRKSGRVVVSARQEDGALIFDVADDGIGMDVEVKRKIFTTFCATKGSSGTGLGLLTTRKVVQEHGGRISVDSEVGKGTRFTITLPRERLPGQGGTPPAAGEE